MQTRRHMYVALQDDDRIAIYTMDTASGSLHHQEDVLVEGGPAPLALSPDRRVLHVGLRGAQAISSYRVDPHTGRLSLIGTAPLQGEPVYVATDRTGRFVLSAYYYQRHRGGPPRRERRRGDVPAGRVAPHVTRRPCHPDRPVEPLRLRSAHREPGTERDLPVPLRRRDRPPDAERSAALRPDRVSRPARTGVPPDTRRRFLSPISRTSRGAASPPIRSARPARSIRSRPSRRYRTTTPTAIPARRSASRRLAASSSRRIAATTASPASVSIPPPGDSRSSTGPAPTRSRARSASTRATATSSPPASRPAASPPTASRRRAASLRSRPTKWATTRCGSS